MSISYEFRYLDLEQAIANGAGKISSLEAIKANGERTSSMPPMPSHFEFSGGIYTSIPEDKLVFKLRPPCDPPYVVLHLRSCAN